MAGQLLATTKDIRIVTYYCWARLHQDGEAGLADGLELLAGLLQRYGMQLYPQRLTSSPQSSPPSGWRVLVS
ncbi:type VI secretion system ImpA family N-terminal domain-containing protein [Klebsiella pneumoniae subsp. pneumoniae]|nr:type VI secretion system ImpA family N-terminal domain-containing protein [Klebsiella pneumoniae subsp. pneumoniae]